MVLNLWNSENSKLIYFISLSHLGIAPLLYMLWLLLFRFVAKSIISLPRNGTHGWGPIMSCMATYVDYICHSLFLSWFIISIILVSWYIANPSKIGKWLICYVNSENCSGIQIKRSHDRQVRRQRITKPTSSGKIRDSRSWRDVNMWCLFKGAHNLSLPIEASNVSFE
jgi:hypothetical protein